MLGRTRISRLTALLALVAQTACGNDEPAVETLFQPLFRDGHEVNYGFVQNAVTTGMTDLPDDVWLRYRVRFASDFSWQGAMVVARASDSGVGPGVGEHLCDMSGVFASPKPVPGFDPMIRTSLLNVVESSNCPVLRVGEAERVWHISEVDAQGTAIRTHSWATDTDPGEPIPTSIYQGGNSMDLLLCEPMDPVCSTPVCSNAGPDGSRFPGLPDCADVTPPPGL